MTKQQCGNCKHHEKLKSQEPCKTCEVFAVNSVNSKWEKLDIEFGYIEGEICNREHDGKLCKGVIEERDKNPCTCHLGMPPCGACVELRGYCDKCGWEDEEPPYPYIKHQSSIYTPLCIVKKGTYTNMSDEEVKKHVKGNFGGYFNYCGNGKFEFCDYIMDTEDL